MADVTADTAAASASPAVQRRRELARFLRSRRERLTPEQMELPASGRRRTPGLRREEVAAVAGVGVTWYTWLEQARDIRVSEQVLDAVARALLLDSTERRHVFTLAGVTDRAPSTDCTPISPAVRAMMDQLMPFPAAVLNDRYDILAYNRSYRWLVADLDAIPAEDHNTMWLMFTHPRWREVVRDWEAVAGYVVAQFRSNMAEHVSEPSWKCLVSALRQRSADFTRIWDRNDVMAPRIKPKQFDHPAIGPLDLEQVGMWFGPRTGVRLTCYPPRDDATAARLKRLAALPAEQAVA